MIIHGGAQCFQKKRETDISFQDRYGVELIQVLVGLDHDRLVATLEPGIPISDVSG